MGFFFPIRKQWRKVGCLEAPCSEACRTGPFDLLYIKPGGGGVFSGQTGLGDLQFGCNLLEKNSQSSPLELVPHEECWN